MKVQYKLSCAKFKYNIERNYHDKNTDNSDKKTGKYRSFSCTTNHGKAKRQQ